MKKTVAAILMAVMLLMCLSAGTGLAEKKISVVTTIFPVYDWVRAVVGDSENVEITMLLDTGVDLHSYQPTAQDILKLAASDLFIYVGGESDGWVEDALKQSVNPDMRVINLMEALGDDVKAEEVVEGMEEHEHEHDDHDHEEEEEVENDEHIWLSLKNAGKLVNVIDETLEGIDPDRADAWRANAEAYGAKLSDLDAAYAAAVAAGDYDTLLFGDRFPFRYMADDYGLRYYAAFSGCSAESEASFETIAFLAGKVDELGLPAVLTIEGANHRIAETIVQTTQSKDQKILSMNSLQATTARDVADGVAYLDVMADNLEVLKQALTK